MTTTTFPFFGEPRSNHPDYAAHESGPPTLDLYALTDQELMSLQPLQVYDEDGDLPAGFSTGLADFDPDDLALLLRVELDRLLTRVLLAAVGQAARELEHDPTRTEVSTLLRRLAPDGMRGLANPLRGLLVRIPAAELRSALDHLVAVGLLAYAEIGSRRLRLTVDGTLYLQSLGEESGAVGVLRKLLGCEPESALNRDLKAFRREHASRFAKPAYRVLTNRAIEGIATRRPLTLSELSKVPSVGPVTLANVGTEVLAIVRRHAEAAAT